jgi:hypothetical protein
MITKTYSSSGFQVFKRRLMEELGVRGLHLDDCAEDDHLFSLYRQSEPTQFIVEQLCGAFDG